jgi:hypothetical protein
MCRTPEIVETRGSAFQGGPEHVGHRCVNCDRWAHECPLCHEVRCDSDLHMSMVGSFPLACKVCRPNGIRQTFTLGHAGVYSPGGVLEVDDPEIHGFEVT